MKPITIAEFKKRLNRMVAEGLWEIPVFVKGPPGVGKSSVIEQVAHEHDLPVSKLAIAQLGPQDLKGLPVTDMDEEVSRWLPPEELPQEEGPGVLVLSEYVDAPPAIQKIAQRLIHERTTGGSYAIPDGHHVIASGNQIEGGALHKMPAPTANRFVHFAVESDLSSFRRWGMLNDIHPHILAFTHFRSELLCDPRPGAEAFPTPRTWERADRLYRADIPLEHAVGEAAEEFRVFLEMEDALPGLDAILAGEGEHTQGLPEEPSAQYAVVAGLAGRSDTGLECFHAAHWMVREARDELTQLLFSMISPELEEKPQERERFIRKAQGDKELRDFMARATALGLGL